MSSEICCSYVWWFISMIILIFSKFLENHHTDVRRVLQRLRDNNLYCKLENCEFHCEQVKFLGYVISTAGFSMDPKKLSPVLQWPRPVGLRPLQRFLGIANYYRKFFRNFLSLVKPLTNMTRKDWSPDSVNAFESLKAAFASALVLVHPDLIVPFHP
ncbi:uncharacterized mitochondrial protein AtMg00860-like [Rana temporaria]|uniref:uncharacterized mitochondrial protein AtMg00860-like n=1 Tax=Rana temporaria TaxID=8407 RepID=UPI001AAD7E7A|nr:uncharacterized mitochondrial protein AtMg00860-like [Rana temporaria]